MHYKKLLEAHNAFYEEEPRAYNYDRYLRNKDWKKWTDSVPIAEIKKLFHFIRSWDRFFQGDEEKFREIYEEIYPVIKELEHKKIEDEELANRELKRKIQDVFDKVVDCTTIGRYESTDASKILHTILPNFFVMWDMNIREEILGDKERRDGSEYAYEFLPKVQRELEEAIKTCMAERNLSRVEAIKYICKSCGGKTLAKLADEHNYMKYTMNYSSLWLEEKETILKVFPDKPKEVRWIINKGWIDKERIAKQKELDKRAREILEPLKRNHPEKWRKLYHSVIHNGTSIEHLKEEVKELLKRSSWNNS